ncbi:MAG: hypothetical protein ACNA7W_18780 [Pseudomonadales bacterium]
MSAFGWDYPAGAEFDPAAPWNQHDADECTQCGADVEEGDDNDPCQECQDAYYRHIDAQIDERRERRHFGDE